MMSTGFLMVTANTGPIARSWGFSAGALALAATLSPMANGTSRVLWGWASDFIGRETAMVIAFLLNSASLVFAFVVRKISGSCVAFSLVLVILTSGEFYSLFPSTAGDYFGTRHATSNYAVLYTAKGVGAVGGWLGARVFEQFGSWSLDFYG